MHNQELVRYIQEASNAGQTMDQIRESLRKVGWGEGDIAEAEKYANGSSVTPGFFKKRSRDPKLYFGIAAVLLIAAAIFLYPRTFLKEELSEFELTPLVADAAGIAPNTAFILKSTADLSVSTIQKYLKFEPEIEYAIKKNDSTDRVFEIAPAHALAENVVYAIAIAEGPIAAHAYSWAYQVKAPFQVITSLPRDKATFVPVDTGIEITFNRQDLIDPKKSFEIVPEVPGKLEAHRDTLIFIPQRELEPRMLYTIRIKAGLKASGIDEVLAEDAEIRFETGEKYGDAPRPSFDFSKRFFEFKPDADMAFEVRYGGISSQGVSLAVYQLEGIKEFTEAYKSSVNEKSSWSRYHAYVPISMPAEKKVFESSVPLEEQASVRFIRMPQKLQEGFYLADVFVGNEHKQTWFQVTSIASFSAVSGSKTFLWFKDLESGRGIANADVSFDGTHVGKTGGDGVAMFDTPPQLVGTNTNEMYHWYFEPALHFFVVTVGEKHFAVPVENEWGGFSKLHSPDSWWDYFSTDKTVYLPTDTVHFWGIVRQRNGTDVKGEKLTIQLTDPFWEGTPREDVAVYGTADAVVSDFYTLTGDIRFSDLGPGLYQLNVIRAGEIIVSEAINVKTYVKPAYRLIINPDKNAVFAGDTITYSVKAEFFDGTPVSNAKLKYEGYFESQVSGEVQVDQDGNGSFAVKTTYQESQYSYWPRYFGMTVSPAVAEEGEINTHIPVLVFGPRIDLKSTQTISQKTSRFELDLRTIVLEKVEKGGFWWNADVYRGDPVAGRDVTADVVEIVYQKTQTDTGYDVISKTTYPIYRYWTEERPVKQSTLTTDGTGKAGYEWAPEKGKTYRITFTVKDAAGRIMRRQHYAYGESFSYFGPYGARGVNLKNINEGKARYASGEEMRLEMQDMGGSILESGAEKFAFVRMVNGIISYQVADSPEYRDAFEDSYVPNVQIMGVWFTGSRFSNSYPVNFAFDAEERRLNVGITKNKERYRPRDMVELAIRVTDKNNNPKRAEVNVAGIDEAVFSIDPIEKDIVNFFYRNIFSPLMVRSSHMTPLEGGAEGGGCFAKGTKVLTPDGEKPIEELRVGDEVVTRASEYVGEMVTAKITQVGSYLVNGHFVVNDRLGLTPNHVLFVNDSWKRAGKMRIGDMVTRDDGGKEKVVSLTFVPEWELVYNIELEDRHTYFADGVYVHNEEKGGGMERADFRDLAIYESIRTDADGMAKVSFAVPDNVTSWRITAQAITKDLFAGKAVDFVPVGLPFFVDATMNATYLAGDNVMLRARVFGSAYTKSDVMYAVESDIVPGKKIERSGKESVEIPLGALPAGKHRVTISAKTGEWTDVIVRDLVVLPTYFSKNTMEIREMSPGPATIRGAAKGYTALSFSSYERGRFYNALRNLAYHDGVRIDQKFGSIFAKMYLKEFFGETHEIMDMDISHYQHGGGVTLLPYSDADLELTAKFANLLRNAPIAADRESLKRYLYASLSDRKADADRIVASLYGLSAFREPVLAAVQRMKDDQSITLKSKIYLALALDGFGAKEEARAYYRSAIKPALVSRVPFIYADTPNDHDGAIIATGMLAGLAADLAEPEADGLGRYIMEMIPKETVKNFEILLYAQKALPLLKGGEVSFSYEALAKSGTKTLKNGETFLLDLSAEELAALSFQSVNGRIGIISSFSEESTPAEAKKDQRIGISRTYSVDGRQTNEFKEGDLVKISLAPSFKSDSFGGAYQVVDHLPSGLRAVTHLENTPFRGGGYPRYPSRIEDQKITFVVWKDLPESFFYYARVVSKGDYKAEPVFIQSVKSAESSNVSDESIVTIR